jgi:hypothetical protein
VTPSRPSGDPALGTQPEPAGLSDDELEAEAAVELPDREAMSIVGLPGVPVPTDVTPDALPLEPDA